MKFSVVIPTYNRLPELIDCLNSILASSLLPSEVLVVDDGDLGSSLDQIKESFLSKSITFRYFHKDTLSLSKSTSISRNLGMEKAENEIFFILDDDLLLDKNFFDAIMSVWHKNENNKLLGVAGVITNNRAKSLFEKSYNYFFCLTGDATWDVNNVCFQSWDDKMPNQEIGYYVHGGVCSYSKNLAKQIGFKTFGGKREALEDIDFCLRAKNAGLNFIVEPKAKTLHKQSPTQREAAVLAGMRESFSRKQIYKSQNSTWILFPKFVWANVGWILRQILVGKLRKAWGLTKGLITS